MNLDRQWRMTVLKQTTSVLERMCADVRRIVFTLGILTQGIYIAYLLYAYKVGRGYGWANLLLLALSLAYLAFYIATRGMRGTRIKRANRRVKRAYKYAKLGMRALTLGVTVYGFYFTAANATPGAVLLTALMLIGWIIHVAAECILYLIERRLRRLAEALKRDTAPLRAGILRLIGRGRKPPEDESENTEYTERK